MKKSILLICLPLLLSACNLIDIKIVTASGNIITQKHLMEGFRNLEIRGHFDVTLEQGPDYRVDVETDDNVMPYVEVKKEGHKLMLRLRHNITIRNGGGVKIKIMMPIVEKIEMAGSGQLKTLNQITSKGKITIDQSGSGSMEMNLKAPDLDADITGSGSATMSGETRHLGLGVAGSGEYHGGNLKSENADVSVTGSGSATVFASVSLNATITGSGQIHYKGNPPSVKKSITGSGTAEPNP